MDLVHCMMRIWMVLVWLCCGNLWSQEDVFDPQLLALLPDDELFPFGVASGDPRQDKVTLWTKLHPSHTIDSMSISWVISSDSSMQIVLQTGATFCLRSSAYTAMTTVSGLAPDQYYYYQFRVGDHRSDIGRTRTSPIEGQVTLAVVSCADLQRGYFNAYRHLAQRRDLHAVVHLGDYIYENGARPLRKKTQGKSRSHIPAHSLRSLIDYRTRYGQYRLDPALQEAHRLHPFITVWDDHEFSNNAYPSIGDNNRHAAARQAYLEWLPIRQQHPGEIFRTISFGKMVDLYMLDTRMSGRSAQAKNEADPSWQAPERTILGPTQYGWLSTGLKNSKAHWQVLGNQVLFSPLHDSRVFSRVPAIKMDRWDGYPQERTRFLNELAAHDIEDLIVLTGDVHTAWALEITTDPSDAAHYDAGTGTGVIGAEFITPSVSSFNFNDILPRPVAWVAKSRFKKKKHNPHLRYLDLVRHGYLSVTFTDKNAEASWHYFSPRRETCKLQKTDTYIYDKEANQIHP